MKKRIIAMILIFTGLTFLQGCESGYERDTSVESSTISDDSVTINKDYEPFEITDEGGFDVGDDYDRYYTLKQVITILKERDVPIIDMKGSKNLNINDGGSVCLDGANFDFDFDKSVFLNYDIEAIKEVFDDHDLGSVYIETPWELFTFRASGDGNPFPDFDEFSMSTVRISHPKYATEKGIKIGDTSEQIEAMYKIVFDNRSYKGSEEDWSISGDVGYFNGFITFVGDDSGVKYIEVGGRYAS